MKTKGSDTPADIPITLNNSTIRYVRVPSRTTKRAISMKLHEQDLNVCIRLLDQIKSGKVPEQDLREAVATTILVRLMSCFEQSGLRHAITANSVFANDPQGKSDFDFFHNIRNKFLSHDENNLRQGIAGVVLSKIGSVAIDTVSMATLVFISTLRPTFFEDLERVCNAALFYTNAQYNSADQALRREVNAMSLDQRAGLEPMAFPGSLPDVGKTRSF